MSSIIVMNRKVQKYCRLFAVSISAIALNISMTSIEAKAELFNSTLDRLPTQERVALRQGQSLVTGSKGKYTGKVLVKATVATAWQVLTDYNNFYHFFPNVVSSKVIQNNGAGKVFEQVQVIRAFMLTKKARVRIAIKETYPKRIAFNLVAGDLKSLQGTWQIEPVSPYPGALPNQVLITHQVNADPGAISTRGLFFSIYKNSLENTLVALKTEVEKRSAKK
ncbi:SRPBCC family protein [Synechocystis sp. PCC 7509]|uniref:SRPBCC family protein n=1 Tax=Synechocystis sp. PCC 7509 TaxID=927677 RepID=UPI0002DB4D93|nr:SRPBCC family protein [Synechocystis sp. PCC 7509]